MAHITGGGLTENLPRVFTGELAASIDLSTIPTLPIMAWLSKVGGISEYEMLKTFNCGIGMILAVAQDHITAVESVLIAHDVEPVRIGEVIKGQRVQYSGQLSF